MKLLPLLVTANSRTRIFVTVFAVACVVGLIYDFARPAVYVSSSRVQVEAPPGQVTSDAGDSAPNLLNATQALTSSAVLKSTWQALGGATGIGDSALRGMLSATPIAGTNVIELHAEGDNRELLPRALDAWIEAYRRNQAETYDLSSSTALEAARAAAQQLQADVAARRLAVEQFRKKYDIVSLEREENQASARLKGLNTAINEARNKEVNAEARLNVIRASIAAGKPVAGTADRAMVVELEKRAADLRSQMKDMEQDYTAEYLELFPKYKALRANLTRLERQIEQERKSSAELAQQNAEEEMVSNRQAVARLQQELSERKREAQDFASRFSEHTALTTELGRLEETNNGARERVEQLERDRKGTGAKLNVLSQPLVPGRPDRPDYWRDAAIALGGAGLLGFLAVWFVEFFRRSGVPGQQPMVQPTINISYSPGMLLGQTGVAGPAYLPPLGSTATRLPETIPQLARELSVPEVRALWAAAMPDARVVIAGLLGGLSLEELAALRYEHVDLDGSYVRVPGISVRSCTLRDPLRRLLIERRAAKGGDIPLTGGRGEPLNGADLEGLITCAACDAGLANPAEVTSEALRHTYFAYLIRQGARLAEIGEFIGRIPPASFRDYGRLSPPGPGLPLEEIDPVFPALRAPVA